jgi:hypothetical protein
MLILRPTCQWSRRYVTQSMQHLQAALQIATGCDFNINPNSQAQLYKPPI